MNKPELTKICGLSTPEALDAVIEGGATHAGFIFYEKSPRNISIENASRLSELAANRILKVAVTVDCDDAMLDAIVRKMKPDILQLHGKETADRIRTIKEKYRLKVIKACAIRQPEDLEAAKAYLGVADMMLFDAKPPEGSDLPGGNGVAFDWEIMDHWPKDVPYMLSGGLNISNIAEALEQTRASAIDVSSGVETSPGKKDTRLIEEFLARVT